MKKVVSIILAMLISGSVGFFIGKEVGKTTYEERVVFQKCSVLDTVAKFVAQDKYDDFECHYKSVELIKKLRELGFEANYCYGKFQGEPHAWVCVKDVWIEATTGEIIVPKYQKDDYLLIKEITNIENRFEG